MQNNRISFLKLAAVYIVSFFVVLAVLNFSTITDALALVRNKFTDHDEVLETELLMAAYQNEKPVLITTKNYPELIHDQQIGSDPVASAEKNFIFIPKINIKAPIVTGSSIEPNKLLKDLERGVLMYPGSALPGQGSTVIIGHSSSNFPWKKYSNVFSLLNRLQAGDLVYVNYADQRYVYKINIKKTGSVFSLSKTDLSGDLILSSCWPVGTDNGRILISATLLK